MTESEFIKATADACRRDHKSRKTMESYTGYAARYARWLRMNPAVHGEPAEVKVSTHLGWLATRPGGCSVRTQLGALNALVFAYAKALKRAAGMARLPKRITVHTLRHSFATAYLEGGGSIHKLQELLGHTSLETTEVYTHCVRQFAADVRSPLDALRMGERKVVDFPGVDVDAVMRRGVA